MNDNRRGSSHAGKEVGASYRGAAGEPMHGFFAPGGGRGVYLVDGGGGNLMRIVILLVLLPALALAQGQGKNAQGREAEFKKAIAAGWVELASWCESKKLDEEGKKHNDEALSLDPDNARAKVLKEKLAGASGSTEGERKEYERKLETASKKLSALYVQLSKEKHAPADQPKYDAWLMRGFELDAKAGGPALDAEAKDAYGKKEWTRALKLLGALEKQKSDPARAKLLKEVELKGAETSAILRKASTHEMQYYLALPKGWSPARKWTIGVGVEGAGCNWMGMMNGLMGARGDKPLILVTPVTFSNTNGLNKDKYPYPQETLDEVEKSGRMKFDEAGLLAVLDDVRREFNGEEKFCITGFSGGGNLCWRMTFGHPEMLLASAPACANFFNPGEISKDPARETIPIKAFQGDKDEYLKGLDGQWQMAKKLLDEHGFKNVSYVMLPGVGHSGCAKDGMEHWSAQLKPAK